MAPINGKEQPRAWAALAELLAILGLLAGGGYLLSGSWGFTALPVHPFWLPVLLLAAQYGLVWGLVTAGLGATLELSFASLGTGYGQLPLERLEEAGPLAAAWLMAAVIVGTARDRASRRLAEAEAALTWTQAANDLLTRDATNLRHINDAMRLALARGRTP